MSKSRPAVTRLSDLKPGDRGTFFALLAERVRGTTQTNKPYYTCRFKDLRRTATYMVWADGPHFAACDNEWQAGQFFKVRGVYAEHERYGPRSRSSRSGTLRTGTRPRGSTRQTSPSGPDSTRARCSPICGP